MFMRLYFLLYLFTISYSLFSQDSKTIYFKNYSHDFGTIKEIEGVVDYTFEFVNKGNIPIIIKNIETSCGCTSVKWTKAPVLPLKSGYIKIQFNPFNRPGNFSKIIKVSTNNTRYNITLKIHGNVEPRVRTELDSYPFEYSSGLRFQYDCLTFMRIKYGNSKIQNFSFYNNSSSRVLISFGRLPSNIKIIEKSNIVEPQQVGYVKMEYSSSKDDLLGLYKKEVDLLVNGKSEPINICADIREDFSRLSQAEKSGAPRISFDKVVFDFGEISSGSIINTDLKIYNKGESILKVRRIYSDRKLSYTIPDYNICSNSSTVLNIKISTEGLIGRQNIVVRVISNDPSNQEIKLRFIGNIK